MVVRLRLARHGQRNRPFYRIVAADARAPRDGRFIEIVGFYNPLAHSRQEAAVRMKRVKLNIARIRYWLSVGAQPSDTVGRLLGTSGLFPFHPRSFRDPSTESSSGASAGTSATVEASHTAPLSSTAPVSRGLHDAIHASLEYQNAGIAHQRLS